MYSYSKKYNYIINYRAKSGCSLVRRLFLELHQNELENKTKDLWHSSNDDFFLHNKNIKNDLPNIYVCRNPYNRVVSMFCNKYCGGKGNILSKNKEFKLNKTTFREFVLKLYDLKKNNKLNNIDVHIKTQACDYINNINSYIVKLEKFDDEIIKIYIKLGFTELIPKIEKFLKNRGFINKTPRIEEDIYVYDKEYDVNNTIFPSYKYFYDKELLNLVYEIYEKDFISFGYKKFIIYENNILSMIETDYLEMEKEKYIKLSNSGGATSEIYISEDKKYIIKKIIDYFYYDVFEREVFLLYFLGLHNIDFVPKLISYNIETKSIKMTYCGEKMNNYNKPNDYLEQLNNILTTFEKLGIKHNDIKDNSEFLLINNKIYLCDFGWATIDNNLNCNIGLWEGDKPYDNINDKNILKYYSNNYTIDTIYSLNNYNLVLDKNTYLDEINKHKIKRDYNVTITSIFLEPLNQQLFNFSKIIKDMLLSDLNILNSAYLSFDINNFHPDYDNLDMEDHKKLIEIFIYYYLIETPLNYNNLLTDNFLYINKETEYILDNNVIYTLIPENEVIIGERELTKNDNYSLYFDLKEYILEAVPKDIINVFYVLNKKILEQIKFNIPENIDLLNLDRDIIIDTYQIKIGKNDKNVIAKIKNNNNKYYVYTYYANTKIILKKNNLVDYQKNNNKQQILYQRDNKIAILLFGIGISKNEKHDKIFSLIQKKLKANYDIYLSMEGSEMNENTVKTYNPKNYILVSNSANNNTKIKGIDLIYEAIKKNIIYDHILIINFDIPEINLDNIYELYDNYYLFPIKQLNNYYMLL